MLILEIALGIVLAVLILNYGSELISGALVGLVIIVAAIAVLLLILYAFDNTKLIVDFIINIALLGIAMATASLLLVVSLGLVGMICLTIPGVKRFGKRHPTKIAGALPPVGLNFYAFVSEKINVIQLSEIEASTILRRWWIYLCDRAALGIITILGALLLSLIVIMLYIFLLN
jgi:hypothetical protein